MLESTKQQELGAALAGWGQNRVQALRSKVALAVASNPDLAADEALQSALKSLETKLRAKDDAALGLVSTVESIADPVAKEGMRRSLTSLVRAISSFEDRVLNGEPESLPERYELFRKIRSTFEEKRPNDPETSWDQWVVEHLNAVEKLLLPPGNGNAATLALASTLTEPLRGEAGFPRCWEILAYLLPRESRQRIYEPMRRELLNDYGLSHSCRRGWWSRLAINGVFLVRTLHLAGECGRVLFASKAVQFWSWVVARAMDWIIRFLRG